MPFAILASKLFSLALGIIGLSFLVGIHELGHFFFCKLFNVRTPSFSIGFGPRLITKKIGETEFALSAIPLGGYVEIAGIQEVGQGCQEEATSRDERAFSSKPYYQKLLILLGGIAANLGFAYGALTLLFALYGMPATPLLAPFTATNTVETVIPQSPAEKAELKTGDAILAINADQITPTGIERFFELLQKHAGTTIKLTIKRDGSSIEKEIQLAPAGQGTILGVALASHALPPLSWTEAFHAAIKRVNSWISGTFTSLTSMIRNRTTRGLGGPVAVLHGISSNAHQGFAWLLIILAFISVGLACLNVLPLPIFDGGQVLFYTIEALTGWSLERVRLYIHYASWIFVLALTLYLSWNDIVRILFSK